MAKRPDMTRLERLEALAALLRAGEAVTTMALARELGVSQRTILRDIELLRARDLPIESDRGRGGGLRLHRNWSVANVQFNYREALDILVGLAVAEKIGTILFPTQARSVRRKLAAAFAAPQRDRIRLLRKRVLVGESASTMVLSSYRPVFASDLGLVLEGFFELKRLSIWYDDAQAVRTERLIEPQYLFLNWPVWYLLAWDHLREDVRFFRLDRIRKVVLDHHGFRQRDESLFQATIEGLAEPV